MSEVLTVPEVAKRLSMTTSHVRALIKTGIIPGFRRGKRFWGVLLVELEKWITGRHQPKAQEGEK